MLDPVLLPELHRLHAELQGDLVHHPLDAEGGLRTPGAAVGVGERLGGEDVGAVEPVGRDLVDRVEHERAEDRHARPDQAEVGAHVGQELDVQAGDLAVLGHRHRQVLDLVTAVVGGEQGLRAGLGPLHRLAQLLGDQQGDDLLGSHGDLAAEAAADVRRDDAELVLGQAEGQREHRLEDVRHLGRGPHDQLLAGRVDDRGARLHEHRHEALLAEAARDHDLVVGLTPPC